MTTLGVLEGTLAVIGGLTILKITVKSARSRKNKVPSSAIARISLQGQIKGYQSARSPLGAKTDITTQSVEQLVRRAMQDNVIGFIFEIDSPGGSVVPSKEIANLIGSIEQPTVALVKGHATSGAYWVASACDHIVASEYSMLGSIGVIMPHLDFSALAERVGLRYDGIKTGQFKDMGNPFRPFTEAERTMLQGELQNIHDGFVTEVAENRNLSVEKAREIANGRFFHGSSAKQLGLVDTLGGLAEAFDYIRTQAKAERPTLHDYKAPMGFMSKLLNPAAAAQSLGRAFAQGMLETVSEQHMDIR